MTAVPDNLHTDFQACRDHARAVVSQANSDNRLHELAAFVLDWALTIATPSHPEYYQGIYDFFAHGTPTLPELSESVLTLKPEPRPEHLPLAVTALAELCARQNTNGFELALVLAGSSSGLKAKHLSRTGRTPVHVADHYAVGVGALYAFWNAIELWETES